MSQSYSDPKRASDLHALPDVEVFHWDGEQGTAPTTEPDEYLVWDCDKNEPMPGWYWWPCFPGCLPDSEPSGPFASYKEALADAQSNARDTDHA